MSLIDPSTRWRNRKRTRRIAAWCCWIMSAFMGFTVGWKFKAGFVQEEDAFLQSGTLIAILFPLCITFLLVGTIIYLLTSNDDDFKPRVVFVPMACLFMSAGLGKLTQELILGSIAHSTAASFVTFAVIVAIIGSIAIRHVEQNKILREKVIQSGLITQGEVTHARRFSQNYASATYVIVAFVDHEGRMRWTKQTVEGTAKVGQKLIVRYSPSDLGKTAAVVVDP